jgi:hypothetical protein
MGSAGIFHHICGQAFTSLAIPGLNAVVEDAIYVGFTECDILLLKGHAKIALKPGFFIACTCPGQTGCLIRLRKVVAYPGVICLSCMVQDAFVELGTFI